MERNENRHNECNETIDYILKKEARGDAFSIRPEAELEIGRIEHNPEVLQRVYDKGRAVAEKISNSSRRFGQKNNCTSKRVCQQ